MLLPILRDEGREKHGEILGRLRELVEEDRVKPLVHEEVFDFKDVGRAHELLESGKAIGKVALRANW
jgi:NADPH2:quinone reductase